MNAPQCSVESGRLLLQWPDRQIELDGELLRGSCRCSECRSRQLHGDVADTTGVELRSIAAMGYGMQLVFSDGHEKGIFPWRYLAELAVNAAPIQ